MLILYIYLLYRSDFMFKIKCFTVGIIPFNINFYIFFTTINALKHIIKIQGRYFNALLEYSEDNLINDFCNNHFL